LPTAIVDRGSRARRLHMCIVRSVRSANAHDDLLEPSLAPQSEPFKATESVQRLAVQQQARRRVGVSILHRCPCGGIACCNGLFDSAYLQLVNDFASDAQTAT